MRTWLGIGLLACALPAWAMPWQGLWLRADQQAMRLLKKGQAQQAAQTFRDPQWQAVAQYRAGDYAKAAQQFSTLTTEDAAYNRGNALALQGDYQGAIAAYDAVLKKNPQHRDAAYNRELIKKRMQQQQNQQQSSAQAASQPHASSQASTSKGQQPAQPSKAQQNKPTTQRDKSAPAKSSGNTEQSMTEKSSAQNPALEKPAAQQAPKSTQNSPSQGATKKAVAKEETTQQQQANEQWLRQIPDDPGGLLRQKFLRDHERMRQ